MLPRRKRFAVACLLLGVGYDANAAQTITLFDDPIGGVADLLSSSSPGTTLSFDLSCLTPIHANTLNVTDARLRYSMRSVIETAPSYAGSPDEASGPTVVSTGFEPYGGYDPAPYVIRSDYERIFFADNLSEPRFSITTAGMGTSTYALAAWTEDSRELHEVVTNEIDFIAELAGEKRPEIVEIDTYDNIYKRLSGVTEEFDWAFGYLQPVDDVLDFELSFVAGTGWIEILSAELLLTTDEACVCGPGSAVPLPAAALLFPGALLAVVAGAGMRRRLA
jgi:hypothetical protein